MYIFFKNKYIKNLIFNIFNYLNEGRIIMAKFKNVYLKLISEMNENINNKNLRKIPTGLTAEKDYEIMKSVMRSVI